MSQLSHRGPPSIRKRIRQQIERIAAQGVAIAATGLTDNPVIGSVAGTAFLSLEETADEYLFGSHTTNSFTMAPMRKKAPTKRKTTWRGSRSVARVPRLVARSSPEIKHFDLYSSGSLGITSAYTVFSIGAWPTQGSDNINRIGRKIKVLSCDIQCQFSVTAPSQVYLTGDIIKCEFFKDVETRGTVASATAIYDTTVTGTANFVSPKLVEAKRRFHLLHSSSHPVIVQSASGTTVVSTALQPVMHVKKRLNDIVTFSANAGAIGDVVTTSYYMLCAHQQANPSTSAYSLGFYARFYYVDN